MTTTEINLDLARQVARIARRAGKAICRVYDSEDFGIETKQDDSPLTRADQASNKVIEAGLEKLATGWPIISEENKQIPYASRRHYATLWLVDPLDGTKEFIKRNGEFTVNIALIHNNRAVLGVVYVPVTRELYYAVAGCGAYSVIGGVRRKLRAATYRNDDTGLRIVSSRSHMNADTAAFIQQFRSPELVSKGSSLKIVMVAAGLAHIYPRLGPTMEWDTAAAQIIVEEAGGTVHQFGTELPVEYNKENLLNPFFIVRGQQLNT